jgi:hypothetical protein
MKKLLLAATALVAATTAQAGEIRDYYRSGAWTNYAGVNQDNNLVCGMAINNTTMGIHIKYINDKVIVQLFKTTWRIPNDTKVSVEVAFDRDLWGSVEAWGGTMPSGTGQSYVSFAIAPGSVDHFLEEMAHADKMIVRFPNGNGETPWVANMTGSRNSVTSFKGCSAKIAGKMPSQPFGSQPSQPYPQPTDGKPVVERGA